MQMESYYLHILKKIWILLIIEIIELMLYNLELI